MAKELIMKATTVEQAKAKIAAAFGVEEDRVTFEVLQQPQKKTLGLFGGADAEVRGTLAEKDPAEAAKAFLSRVLEKMGVVGASVTARVENETCVLAIEGEDLGFIIGRRGETLDALQYLTGLVANRVDNSYYRISIDIGNYREKREQTLEALAIGAAPDTIRRPAAPDGTPGSPVLFGRDYFAALLHLPEGSGGSAPPSSARMA